MNIQEMIKTSFDLWNFKKTEDVAKKLLDKEISTVNGLIVIVALTIISTFFSLIPLFFSGEFFEPWFAIGFIIGAIALLILLIPGFFLMMAWNHLFIKLFKGTKNYMDTVNIFLILMVPYCIFQLIYAFFAMFVEILAVLGGDLFYLIYLLISPISFAIFVYYCIIVVKTFAISHEMGHQNAALAGVVSVGVIFMVFLVIGIIVGFMIGFGAMALNPVIY